MQKMIIIGNDEMHYKFDEYEGLEELNDYLAHGWKVVNMKATSSTKTLTIDDEISDVSHVCYVVIEKE